MKYLGAALSSEVIKLKRTLALLMVVIAPGVISFLGFVIALNREKPFTEAIDPVTYFGNNVMMLWSLLMLPLFIALETALTSYIEHAGNNWKHLFALPVPRTTIYYSKLCVNLFIAFLASVSLYIQLFLGGFLIALIRPDLGFHMDLPWLKTAVVLAVIYVPTMLLVVIHSWISIRWKNIVISLGSGIAAVVMSVIIMQSKYISFYPWTIPTLLSGKFLQLNEKLSMAQAFSESLPFLVTTFIMTIVVAVAGAIEMTRRDVL